MDDETLIRIAVGIVKADPSELGLSYIAYRLSEYELKYGRTHPCDVDVAGIMEAINTKE